MKPDFSKIDSIFFDMDGTLWDAVSSYCKIWEICFEKHGVKVNYTEDDVKQYMGFSIDVIFNAVKKRLGVEIDNDKFLADLDVLENKMMPVLGGKLYSYVRDGIKELSKHYKLFMVSNCGRLGLRNFMAFSGTTQYFVDSLTFGETKSPKSVNITSLIKKYGLKNPVYVGDTQADCDETHLAGIPFVHATYGFGTCANPDMKVESFKEFVDIFLKYKED